MSVASEQFDRVVKLVIVGDSKSSILPAHISHPLTVDVVCYCNSCGEDIPSHAICE